MTKKFAAAILGSYDANCEREPWLEDIREFDIDLGTFEAEDLHEADELAWELAEENDELRDLASELWNDLGIDIDYDIEVWEV